MRRGVLVVAAALAVGCGSGRADEIDYRGERIKLSKAYSDYDSYKNDPNNIHPSERERVQRLVKTAPVAASYADEKTLYQALSALSFPGYGSGNLARTRQPDGSDVLAYGIEIPGTEQDRYLVFRGSGSGFLLVDDFVDASVIGPTSIVEDGREWVYRSANGTVLFRRSKRTG